MKKEKPIIFKPEMVNAIIAGKKTQTRRLYDFENLKTAVESGREALLF